MPALDAIDEMNGRAAELNRPVHVTTGMTSWGAMQTATAVGQIAAFSIMYKVVRSAAKYDVKAIYSSPNIDSVALVQEIMESAYRAEGKLDRYNPVEQIQVKSPYSYGWQCQVLDIIMKNQVAANFVLSTIGAGGGYALMETANRIGAIQIMFITGTSAEVAWFAAICDHTALGPEGLGCGAILSGEPEQIATLIGNDVLSVGTIAIVILASILQQFGNTFLMGYMK